MKSNDIGLTTTYNSKFEPVLKLVKRICVLPLVKLEDINRAFDFARSAINEDIPEGTKTKMQRLIDYVENTWIGPTARFDEQLWSRYDIQGKILSA